MNRKQNPKLLFMDTRTARIDASSIKDHTNTHAATEQAFVPLHLLLLHLEIFRWDPNRRDNADKKQTSFFLISSPCTLLLRVRFEWFNALYCRWQVERQQSGGCCLRLVKLEDLVKVKSFHALDRNTDRGRKSLWSRDRCNEHRLFWFNGLPATRRRKNATTTMPE